METGHELIYLTHCMAGAGNQKPKPHISSKISLATKSAKATLPAVTASSENWLESL